MRTTRKLEPTLRDAFDHNSADAWTRFQDWLEPTDEAAQIVFPLIRVERGHGGRGLYAIDASSGGSASSDSGATASPGSPR